MNRKFYGWPWNTSWIAVQSVLFIEQHYYSKVFTNSKLLLTRELGSGSCTSWEQAAVSEEARLLNGNKGAVKTRLLCLLMIQWRGWKCSREGARVGEARILFHLKDKVAPGDICYLPNYLASLIKGFPFFPREGFIFSGY